MTQMKAASKVFLHPFISETRTSVQPVQGMWKELKFKVGAKAHERCAQRSENKGRQPQDEWNQ